MLSIVYKFVIVYNMNNRSELTLTIQIFKEGKRFVSYNEELGVSSCGDTPEDARHNLREAMSGFIKSARKMGTLDEILEEAGFVQKDKRWLTPQLVTLDRLSLSLS